MLIPYHSLLHRRGSCQPIRNLSGWLGNKWRLIQTCSMKSRRIASSLSFILSSTTDPALPPSNTMGDTSIFYSNQDIHLRTWRGEGCWCWCCCAGWSRCGQKMHWEEDGVRQTHLYSYRILRILSMRHKSEFHHHLEFNCIHQECREWIRRKEKRTTRSHFFHWECWDGKRTSWQMNVRMLKKKEWACPFPHSTHLGKSFWNNH